MRQTTTLTSPIEKFEWLDKLADPLQNALRRVFSGDIGQEVKDWLNGVPLRHRVHPALIVWPLGAWTTAIFLDLLDSASSERHYGAAADTAVAFGVAGALPAAAAGLADWIDTYGHTRRAGMAHASLNTIALTLYATSLALRGSGQRGAGRAVSYLGYGAAFLGASIGGDLVYNLGVNVNHQIFPNPPGDFTDVLASTDLPEGKPVVVKDGEVPVLLLRRDGKIDAVENWCPHAGGPLSEGKFEGEIVQCPWHGSKFCLDDGRPVQGPASSPLRTFEVRERGGRIAIRPSYEPQL